MLARGRGPGAPRDGAVVGGVGHFPWEIDPAVLDEPHTSLGAGRDEHVLPSGKRLVVLEGTRMLNLTAAHGNPIEAMDLGLTLRARGLTLVAGGGLDPGPQPVPPGIEREIAADFVALLSDTAT